MGTYVDKVSGGIGDGVYTMTNAGWGIADARAASAFAIAQDFIQTMGAFSIPFSAVSSGFTAPAIGYTLALPAVPLAPVVSFPVIDALDPLALDTVDPVAPGAAPTFAVASPVVQVLDKPDALVATAPGSAPTVAEVTLPESPTIVLPEAPLMELITLPTLPSINLPTFGGAAPDGSDLTTPTTGLVWSEDYYDSALLNDATSRLTTMLLGGTGLPAAIEQAIWDRSRAREDVIARKATQEVYEEFSARGFSLPPGALAGRVSEVWLKNREAASTLSRDIAVKQAELEIDNMKFAVSTGIQLEGQMMTYAGQFAARALDAAKITVQVALDIFNARIALYNARLQGYQTEAAVFKDLIQAESIKLEQYRTEIEAQKLVGDINLQAIQIYKTRSDALMIAVDLYKAQLEGVKTGVDVDRARIEGFRATVEAYKSVVEAKTSEYQAWGQSIQGEVAKVSAYEAQARAFGTLVDAYKTGETVKIENMKAQISGNEILVKEFDSRVNYLSEQIKAGIAQVDTGVKIYDGQARVYGAQIGGEQARVQALAEQIRLIIAAGSTEAELGLKAADLNIQQLLRIAQSEQEGRKAAGMVAGQLAASAMSSFNLGAHVSASWGTSIGNSLSESHSLTT
ncbi:MAG: hypothetical protein WA085_12690 [Sphingobium sp.]